MCSSCKATTNQAHARQYACNSTKLVVLTVTGVDEDVVASDVVAGGGGGGGAELLTVLDVGCAEVGPGAVPEGCPFWMYMKRPSSMLPQFSSP